MKIKTFNQHLLNLDKRVIEKSAINGISRFLNSLRFVKNEKRESVIMANLLLEIIDNKKDFKLTKEQTIFGINWLKNFYLTKKGLERKRVADDFYGYNEGEIKEIIETFKEFRFIGYTAQWDSWSKVYSQFIPVYKVISKSGKSFNYAPIYMGAPLTDPQIIDSIN